MSEAEVWRDIPEWEGAYSVSNMGRVMSLPRKVMHPTKGAISVGGKILVPSTTKGGYRLLGLYRGGKRHSFLVHRLVAAAFIGPVPEDHEVNHIDGNPANNQADNLEYVTVSENQRHSYKHLGRTPRRGELNGHAKLSQNQVEEIKHRISAGEQQNRLAAEYGVCRQTIFRIVHGLSYRPLEKRLQHG